MIDEENFQEEEDREELNDDSSNSLEVQERLNSNNLVQRIEEEDVPDSNYGDINETTDEPSRGEEDLSDFQERILPDSDLAKPIGSDMPVTKNLLGDNPPGSEKAAFEAGTGGDMGAEQAKYKADNLIENFRENLDKTEQEIELQKKLKNKSDK